MATPSARKAELLTSILEGLKPRFDIEGLRWAGFTQRGGAQILPLTGEVRFEKEFLDALSARALQLVAAHEAGHARSRRAMKLHSGFPYWKHLSWGAVFLGLSVWTGFAAQGLAAALAMATLAAVRYAWSYPSPRRLAWEEEVRADAFSVHYCGGLDLWKAALQDVLRHARTAQKRALTVRQEALEELAARVS